MISHVSMMTRLMEASMFVTNIPSAVMMPLIPEPQNSSWFHEVKVSDHVLKAQ